VIYQDIIYVFGLNLGPNQYSRFGWWSNRFGPNHCQQ